MMLLAVSLKMYFSLQRTLEWSRDVVDALAGWDGEREGVEVAVVPSAPALQAAAAVLSPAGVLVGAQTCSEHEVGAYTGEMSAAMLAELGCRFVEVGHAERRRLYGETDDVVAAKVAAILRNGLTPLLCVGEEARTGSGDAIARCIALRSSALRAARAEGLTGRVVVAYEPMWAIGADRPASPEHARSVCRALREDARADRAFPGEVIYGGSAGPGLLSDLFPDVDGLFLGRFAHDPHAFAAVVREAASLHR